MLDFFFYLKNIRGKIIFLSPINNTSLFLLKENRLAQLNFISINVASVFE